jgi:two-component system NtrC family sensor kinase
VENRSDSPNKTPPQSLALYLDPDILEDLKSSSYSIDPFKLTNPQDARNALFKKGERLWVNFSDGEHCDFPYYLNNVTHILNGLKESNVAPPGQVELFASLIKTNQNIEKRMFSSVPIAHGQNVKDLWDEVIKKINSISSDCHSLGSLIERILDVPFLQSYQTSLVILHIKGQTKAEVLGTLWRGDKHKDLIEVKDFNAFYNSVKKSKIKTFTTDAFPSIDFPFNGSFLAKEVISKKYSLVAIVSRHDFLNFIKDEIELYETCIDLLQPHFERLIDQEFSDKRISELRVCLKDFPLPLRIKDSVTEATFVNDLFQNELQEKDIFFSKKVKGPFSLDLYDSDELHHYAFDLFHFQRISLLGELLNTLRHELSNPLFGLKLGSQVFRTLDAPEDSKEIMSEIEKNINRSQLIIENFSNLYQVQTESKPVLIKKIIEEALVLSKSESREIKKNVNYHTDSDSLSLDVPLIFVVQIIFNLIINATQAMKQENQRGELDLVIHQDKDVIYIDVSDSGPGIPEDKVCELFKPFFTTKPQGTGLGLVLSRNLAVKMGGNLEYLVNNSSKGAKFRLTLPKL